MCGSTDDEDLGLPASLQNSPADTAVLDSLGGSRYWPDLAACPAPVYCRHHSSCSDHSLLSLDSYRRVTTPQQSLNISLVSLQPPLLLLGNLCPQPHSLLNCNC